MKRRTCMYTILQSPPPSHPACTLHYPIHGPDPDQSKLRFRGTSWRVGRYRTVERYSTGQEASKRSRSFHQLCRAPSLKVYFILVVLENLEDVLGPKCIFPVPRRQSDDGVIDLILTQNLVMQSWMRVNSILSISINSRHVKMTHPITWETAFLDDDLPPLLRRSVESSK
jgi:hypothetical protein